MSRYLILSLALLAGCDDTPSKPDTGLDQCMRREIFQQCLKALPAGPQVAKYNDWDEVVQQCESAAYYQSLRIVEHIKPECRV